MGDQFNMTYKRYSIKTIPVDFLESKSMRESINEAIRRIESSIDREEGIDNTYSEFVNLVIGELDKKFPIINGVSRPKKGLYKPYWCEELQSQWNKVENSEKESKNSKSGTVKQKHLKSVYCGVRKTFDKLNRKYKRTYQIEQQEMFSQDFQHDSRTFWKKFGRIAIKK